MKDNCLIKNIRDEYIKARLSIFPSPNILRGTSRTISSFTEDAFAMYVSDILGDQYEIWIDPQIIINNLRNKSGKRKLMFRPDVCVLNKENKIIKMIFDIKMDLGYKRNEFINQVEVRKKELKNIINEKAQCSLKKNIPITFKNSLVWNYIIISKGNISTKRFDEITSYFNKNNEAQIFILSEGDHLNAYNDDFKTEIMLGEFKRLRKEINKIR